MKFDVRANKSEDIKAVVFGDSRCNGAQVTYSCGLFEILDMDGDGQYEIDKEDIDNLILALQKAKELWG